MTVSGDAVSSKIDEYAKTHLGQLRSQESVSQKDMTKYDIAAQMLANGVLTEAEFETWAFETKEGKDSYNSKWDTPSVFGNGFAFGTYDTYNNGSYLDDIALSLEQENPQSSRPLSPAQVTQQHSQQTRTYAADKLLQQAGNAKDNLTDYYNSIGTISFDAVQQGLESIGNYTWDFLTGRNDFTTVYENADAIINNEIPGILRLKNTTKSPEEFNKKFKELYGIDYNEQAFQNLQKADANLQTATAYQNLSDNIQTTLSNIDNADPANVRKAAMFHILPHVGNNKELAQQYITQLNGIAQNDDTKFVQELKTFLKEAKTEYDNQLKSLNKDTLEQEYKEAYKEAMGNYNSEEVINQYISNMKTQATVLEIGTTIAASYFAMGSTAMRTLGTKVMQTTSNLGTKTGAIVGNITIKGAGTAATAAFNPAVTLVSDATSKKGITAQTGQEAWEELKNGMMYGAFGAYVSGPLGDSVSKILSKNPQIFKSIIPKIIGTGTETTADVIFDRLTSDMTVKESLSQNGIMNYGMMFAGSAINKGAKLNNIKVEKQENGSYTLSRNGEVIGIAKNDNELAMSVLVLGSKGQKVQGAPENLTLHPEVPEDHQANIFTQKPQELQQSVETSSNASQGKVSDTPETVQGEIKTEEVTGSEQVLQTAADEVKTNVETPSQKAPEIDDETFAKMQDEIAETLKANENMHQQGIDYILSVTTKDNISLAKEICSNKDFPKQLAVDILSCTNKDNIELSKLLCDNYNKIYNADRTIPGILRLAEKNVEYAKSQLSDPMNDLSKPDVISNICSNIQEQENLPFIKAGFTKEEMAKYRITEDNMELAKELINSPDIPEEHVRSILYLVTKDNLESVREFSNKLFNDKNFLEEDITYILSCTNKDNISIARELCNNEHFPPDEIAIILINTNKDNVSLAKELCNNPDFPKEYIKPILINTNKDNVSLTKDLCSDPDFPKEYIHTILGIANNKDNMEFAGQVRDLIKICKKSNLSEQEISRIFKYTNKDTIELMKELCKNPDFPKFSDADFAIAADFIDLYGKKSINEISMSGKSELIRKLVSSNTGMFGISDKMKKNFPLIPTKTEEYCSLLSSIVKSLGVDIRTIEPPSRIKEFNNNVSELSSSLARIPDAEFANLQISLDYTKDDFVSDVLARVKDLSPNEQQKVYDYFGFELQKNENNKTTGYAIIGYPINLNNGKKLAEITDPRTKAVVEELRHDVVRFSEQNPIKCNNPQVEKLLNEIIDVMPEMRTEIGKKQHGTHDYDVFQHSLKVMQKIAQNPKFQTLNESDQKIMMLASMLHDITKGEGVSDPTHAKQGSFDAFYISKKFNLTREEETKLYTLIRHHEWLGSVNSAKSEDVLTKRLQSVAFDLQNDNLFDMALMFTHADLQAVKKDNTFHDTTQGETRARFDGETRVFDKSQGSPVSHGQAADIYAQRIRGYIEELKTSQPLLPVTKFPKADRINSAITVVNSDGSTNIKGVYKRPDGLIVIKYNEVEDWEKIGFPKGSVSRGYTSVGKSNKYYEQYTDEVNTGNIKFFVHGLDYENQLTKFDAFSLLDSDALLSLSYAERVESKYHFFRPQGVLLDFDTKYIYGGGETDAGSGYGKSLEIFKKDYVFGGVRQSDRVFVSNLIKEATGMNDAEYVKFVEANRNKSFTEIEPAEYREPIIKVFASINSRIRKGGDRAYNEMYGSNPREVMGVFAYSKGAKDNEGAVGNPIQFLEQNSVTSRTEFLQRYALEHNIPFVIFGD